MLWGWSCSILSFPRAAVVWSVRQLSCGRIIPCLLVQFKAKQTVRHVYNKLQVESRRCFGAGTVLMNVEKEDFFVRHGICVFKQKFSADLCFGQG